MSNFTAVATGNPTNATDINQLINAFNGTTASSQMNPTSTANTVNCWDVMLPSSPGSDQPSNTIGITGDSLYRAGFYVTGASGHLGGIFVADGSNIKGHMYGVSSGFRITESLTIDTNLTVSGAASHSGSATFSGTASFSNTTTFSGNVTFDNNILMSTANLANAAITNQYFGFGLNGSGDMGLYAGDGSNISFISSSGIWTKWNNYSDGSNDRYLTTNGAMQMSNFIAPAGVGNVMGIRIAGSGTAGSVITWGQNYNLAWMLGGLRLFTGTGDPTTAAGEGDLWFDG